MLIEVDHLLLFPSLNNVITALDRDKCVAINVASLRWKALDAHENDDAIAFYLLAASLLGETGQRSWSRKGFCKQRLFQVISVITKVEISRRVHPYKKALPDHKGDKTAIRSTTAYGAACRCGEGHIVLYTKQSITHGIIKCVSI